MRTVVGVLRGGPDGYEASLKSGGAVIEYLDKEKYEPRDIFIDRAGQWHLRGIVAAPERALAGVDTVFNALHGAYGAGPIHRRLVALNIPHTGSGALAAMQSRSRDLARVAALTAGIKTPYTTTIMLDGNIERTARRLFRSFPLPMTIIFGEGVTIVRDYQELENALTSAAAQYEQVFVEEYISGSAAEVGVVDDFRGERTYALIPIPEILSRGDKERLGEAAKNIHQTLELSHYSLSRFNVSRRGIYFVEVDALPELHDDAILPQMLAAVGAPMSLFFDHVIGLAKSRK